MERANHSALCLMESHDSGELEKKRTTRLIAMYSISDIRVAARHKLAPCWSKMLREAGAMRTIVRRMATVIAAALAPAAIATVAVAGVGSAEVCTGGRTWDPQTLSCTPPPPAPAWYQAAPSYAQSWAPAGVPPPPPTPDWAKALDLKPVWDPKLETWQFIYVR
jgi:hypothetical protein